MIFWFNVHYVGPKFNFKVNFLCQKSYESFSIFFIKECQFRSTFSKLLLLTLTFDSINFEIALFSKLMPNFWHLPITPILEIQYIWVCWFLSKNLSHFVLHAWKLNNPYYHPRRSIWICCPNLPQSGPGWKSIDCKMLSRRKNEKIW